MRNKAPKLAMLIRRLLEAIKNVIKAIQEHTKSIHAAEEREREKKPSGEMINRVISFDDKAVRDAETEHNRQYGVQNSIRWATWMAVLAAIVYAGVAACQLREMRKTTKAAIKSAVAAQQSADTAANEFEVSQRPWVKIRHRILKPLTFGVKAWQGPVAQAEIEDTIENVGQTVAVDVSSWEDIIPIGPDISISAAELRQRQWCDANRHPSQNQFLGGSVLFPKDPLVQNSTVGPSMETVMEAAANSPQGLTGKVGFVLVGCVCYRAAFELKTSATHQTRFLYYLGTPKEGAFYPWVTPVGVADGLRLIGTGKFSAD